MSRKRKATTPAAPEVDVVNESSPTTEKKSRRGTSKKTEEAPVVEAIKTRGKKVKSVEPPTADLVEPKPKRGAKESPKKVEKKHVTIMTPKTLAGKEAETATSRAASKRVAEKNVEKEPIAKRSTRSRK